MKLGKMCNLGINRWEYVELTEEEVKGALYDLLMINKEELDRCMHLADTMEVGDQAKLRAAMILADKNMISSFTYLMQKLEEKVQKVKSERKSKFTESYNKSGEVPKRELGKPIRFDEKSEVEKAYEGVDK
jgi:hypothetical protein